MNNQTATMPNGRPRQRNTRVANRHRNVQRDSQVRAEPVQEAVVVQAEAVPEGGRYYTNEEIQDLKKENEILREMIVRQKKESVIRARKIIKGAVFEGYNLCHLARESGIVKPLQAGEFYDATNCVASSPDEFMKSIEIKYGD